MVLLSPSLVAGRCRVVLHAAPSVSGVVLLSPLLLLFLVLLSQSSILRGAAFHLIPGEVAPEVN